jgi:hypothetical protein
MAKQDQDQGFFRGQMPVTGEDYIDTQDVEGHRASRLPGDDGFFRQATDPEADSVVKRDQATDTDDDVEGHRFIATPFQGGESDFIKQAPGGNPHGDR